MKRIFSFAAVMLSTALLLTAAFGQGAAIKLKLAGPDGLEVQDFVIQNTISLDLSAGDLLAKPMVFGQFMSADPNQLIHNQQVRENLELDKEQMAELDAIRTEYQERMQEHVKSMQGKNADPNEWGRVMKSLNEDRRLAMGAVLLPHQSKRLQQIATQMEMRNKGDANALIGESLAEALDIDDGQKERLKKRAEEIRQETEEQIARIKEEGRKKLLRELSSEQRRKLDELTGEKFELKGKR
jgi:hypothetical protein